MSRYSQRVATDVGGTFTDLVSFGTEAETGRPRVLTAKVDTTPPNFEAGVIQVMKKAGVNPADVDFLAHGTTVVINALTERKGVSVGLITTEGFRDSLEIARGNRPDFFNLAYKKPPVFVPRFLRTELPGRMTYRGEERQALDLTGLPDIIDHFQQHDVQAVAICFLHAYANPSHEEATLAEVQRLWPEVSTVCSHQITREWREYERTNTTVLSAYVQPVAERYLNRLDSGLREGGLPQSPYIMQSNCGVDSLEATARTPINMVESGPASGVWGAAELGRLIGESNVIALDIGGTTAKCSLIEEGKVRVMTDYWIERSRTSAGYPVMVPVVDLVEIGNGGGSIAWVDEAGKLSVGPQSAGAEPGPMAYGKGGEQVTTTDANLWLGRINKDYFCGGEVQADTVAVKRGMEALASSLGVSADEAARGIVRVANNNMINALKLISINRGYDVREFTLLAFGGGGAMHAVALAQELGVKKVVVPSAASVFSAWGMLMCDLRRDFFLTKLVEMGPDAPHVIAHELADIEKGALDTFAREGINADTISFQRFGKFRYQNQEHTTEVLLPAGGIEAGSIEAIIENFHETYEREYTYRLAAPVELVGLHVVATSAVGKLQLEAQPLGGADISSAVKGQRAVDFALEGVHEATVLDASKLRPGMRCSGPAIVEDEGTTTVVHEGCSMEVDAYFNLQITIESA
jgi:N-methylhydantoinase A